LTGGGEPPILQHRVRRLRRADHPVTMRRSRSGAPAVTPAALLLLVACAGGGAPAAPAIGPHEGAAHPNAGRAAPAFAAQDPSGPWLPIGNLKQKPVALLFFRTGAPFAAELARAFGEFRDDPAFKPTVFLGLAEDSMDRIREFVRIRSISLPILRDPGTIRRLYGAGDLPTVVLLDPDHAIRFQLDGYVGAAFRPRLEATRAFLLTLPGISREAAEPLDLDYSRHPRAPVFTARDLDGRTIDLAALRGKVVVLSFFDQDCPHCRKDLPRMVPVLKDFRGRGVPTIGVTSRDLRGELRRFLKENGIDYPVVVDGERAIFSRYRSTGTPDTFLIDRDGFVRFREEGDRPDRADLTRLQIRILLGEKPEDLAAALPKERFSGDGVCRACHESEYRDWLMTPHSIAWESLQQGDKWRDPECVTCHVTGKGRPGGFVDPETTATMENVQCEVCHGTGGGHPVHAALDTSAMTKVCAGCHNGKFVLNFRVDEALSLVAHRDHPDLERLFKYSDLQRERLEGINKRRLEKFRSGVAYVGAEACRDCHRREYEQWAHTPHAAAFAPLLQQGRGTERQCTRCHSTGQGRPGGFLQEAATQAPMTNVQCEVCHGPGADHVASRPELKRATIYGITNQCSFCIIQGVCTTCHDRANDPRFDIERALPLVRHLPGAS
jgi:peroxiredoxin